MANKQSEMIIPDELISEKIYYIRGQKVMLDEDLARLYNVTTGNLNKAVARNMKRFPDDFMFRLTEEEFKNLLFQNGIASWGGRRQPPNAFTEDGLAMLSGVLSSDRAIQVNIQIMRVFTRLRRMFIDNTELRLDIEKIKAKLDNQDKNMEIVFRYLDELLEKKTTPEKRKRIGYIPDDI
jgi:hypothetical protein